jgi:hypothetical protein
MKNANNSKKCYNHIGDNMKEIKINGIYKHFKGDYYIVLDIAHHSETQEKMIIYRALYNDNKLWVRPYDTFFEEVNKNGQKLRFELQDIKSVRE